jgi:hypothetical protein
MAKVLPFPLASRRDLVIRQALWFCEQSHASAEASLRRQVTLQGEALRRRGVETARASDECVRLEHAIRAEIQRRRPVAGGVA